MQAALLPTRTGRGDKIICLPGHVESIAIADAWSNLGTASDVEIVGVGTGTNRPTITWTTATSTVLFDQANVRLRNCRLFLAGPSATGALTVAAPITITSTGAEITDCEIHWGWDADSIVGIGITTTAAATRFKFDRNLAYAETAAVPTTTFLRLTGTDFFSMDSTHIIGPGSSTTIGPVQQLTTAMLKAQFRNSIIQSTTAAATIAVTAIAGNTGVFYGCGVGVASGVGVTGGSGFQSVNSQVMTAGTSSALVLT